LWALLVNTGVGEWSQIKDCKKLGLSLPIYFHEFSSSLIEARMHGRYDEVILKNLYCWLGRNVAGRIIQIQTKIENLCCHDKSLTSSHLMEFMFIILNCNMLCSTDTL
jgi:hypothetical protein